MANKVGEDFYRKLSRKELQSLCKKYGLPARTSSYEMAESLRSYFLVSEILQRRDLSVSSTGKSFSKIQEAPVPTPPVVPLQPEAPPDVTGNVTALFPTSVADGFVPGSNPGERHGIGSGNAESVKVQSCAGCEANNKEKFDGLAENLPEASQLQFDSRGAETSVNHLEQPVNLPGRVHLGEVSQFDCSHANVAAHPEEGASLSMKTSSRAPASFQFYVSSEQGIKLCVDLNSGPSDWINKYRNQVSLCENVSYSRSQTFHQELGRVGENNKKLKTSFVQGVHPDRAIDGYAQREPSPSSVVENDDIGTDKSGGGSKSLMPSPTVPYNADVDVSKCFVESHQLVSSNPNTDVDNNIISNTESSMQNGYAAALDSDITDVPVENTACNFAVNYISEGSADVTIEHQRSKNNDEVCENSNLQNSCSLENSSVKLPGYLPSHSTEMQLSEPENYHEDASDKLVTLVHSKPSAESGQDALGNSRDDEPSGNDLPTCSEDQDWSNAGNGRESSVCSQVENSNEKTCLVPGTEQPNNELHRKRLRLENESHNSGGNRSSRTLRSAKHFAEEAFPRRSKRLVSKNSQAKATTHSWM
ncbi:hypothetical protein Tsubulata_032725 [Turnera subulata]|uniref:Uncharacterized protein n=1 Tax=Turnera subulata TaxID=218843 RepID=A0A9Q0JJK5_9ROSI|nr:hypothetical protein Tsubulata_032725 [Turnera subulata]